MDVEHTRQGRILVDRPVDPDANVGSVGWSRHRSILCDYAPTGRILRLHEGDKLHQFSSALLEIGDPDQSTRACKAKNCVSPARTSGSIEPADGVTLHLLFQGLVAYT
jgi:hypothetical protein